MIKNRVHYKDVTGSFPKTTGRGQDVFYLKLPCEILPETDNNGLKNNCIVQPY
jgi:hypothetical protein